MTNSTDFLLDFSCSPLDTVSLSSNQIEQAAHLATASSSPEQQWTIYLNTLALAGFETWFKERTRDLSLNKDLAQNILNAISGLRVGEFRLCLLTQGTLDDEFIPLPQTLLHDSPSLPHFYVLVQVDEEREEIALGGVIRSDELENHRQSGDLVALSDETYSLPLTWFEPDINHLLLYLRFLPIASLQSQPQSGSTFRQSIINVGRWLQGELDELAESLAWLLLPTPQLAGVGLRTLPVFEQLLQELRSQGLDIPAILGAASHRFSLGTLPLQVYALSWLLEDSDEWSLLFILGTVQDSPLPLGLKMLIQEQETLLNEQEVTLTTQQNYLYSQVIGELDEQFTVSISLATGEIFTFPSFAFLQEEE
jgi:hypothetical protein